MTLLTRKEARAKIKSISLKQEFYDLLDKVVLSERDRSIMVKFYIEKKQMGEIAEELGVSEPTVLKCHANVLDKLIEVL